jgi:hypothetical protein
MFVSLCETDATIMHRASQKFGKQWGAIQAYKHLAFDPNVVSERQFVHWQKDGYSHLRMIYACECEIEYDVSFCSCIVCEASAYILPAIAVSSMNSLVNHLVDQDPCLVENLLRDPSIESPLPSMLSSLLPIAYFKLAQ